MQRLVVPRTNLARIHAVDAVPAPLDEHEVRLRIDCFGFSSNNISYALFGEALGYWAHFPVDDEHGCVPVWGFADVVESRHDAVPIGTRVFGYLPMATELVVRPDDVSDLAFSDATPHRAALHPWYARYHRCDADPVWSAEHEPIQATMWALFMTGWALAQDVAGAADSVVLSSASSKTALSTAWALRERAPHVQVVAVTSADNVGFVEASGVYTAVTTYDRLELDPVTAPAVYIDAAGSPAVTERVHATLRDRLTDSVVLGATHQGAGAATGELVGPPPRFFFIPDVAEQRAADGHAAYHHEFAAAWQRFRPWAEEHIEIERVAGLDGILATYAAALAGDVRPDGATVLSW